VELPASAAGGPDLTAVITDRKIYRPKDRPGSSFSLPMSWCRVEMEVQLAGQQIARTA